mmetsp:Transcript_141418/g.249857  ORF Transcript_141418/g.249857 Transcript_141418/m.249857 type:complete len:498 (-) Transcript_141418:68-1561(-)
MNKRLPPSASNGRPEPTDRKKWRSADQKPRGRCGATVALQKLYREKMRPVEDTHLFHDFHSHALSDAELAAAPMVLLLGQYSSGKSTFIRHLLGRDYPGLHIGPEPTTDKFVAVAHGTSDELVPGHAVVVDKSMPFTDLDQLGSSFLSKFQCSRLQSPLLEGLTLIDTPGVLSGEKQSLKRGYEFEGVVKWFAARADAIILLFDVSKLDISDEFRHIIDALKEHAPKIRVVLNKADQLSSPQLMRVYGALLWNLGKVIDTPEVTRVYVGSFWWEPLKNTEQQKLFESEEIDLYTMLSLLPRSAATQKLDNLVRRARLLKVHAFILDSLRKKTPRCCGRVKAQDKMIADLDNIYAEVARENNLVLGDFPDVNHMRKVLKTFPDFNCFPKLNKRRTKALEGMLGDEIPTLLKLVAEEQRAINERAAAAAPAPHYAGSERRPDQGPREAAGGSFEQSPFAGDCAGSSRDAPPERPGFTLPFAVPSPPGTAEPIGFGRRSP